MIAVLVGMPEEKEVLTRCFPGIQVLSGQDKLNLDALIPAGVTRIISAGLFGGLAPGIPVGGICTASVVTDKAGAIFRCASAWNSAVLHAGADADLTLGCVSWHSSGLMDESDTAQQRAAIYEQYGAKGMDDETRFAIALAQKRNIDCNVFRSCSDDWTETLPLAARGAIMNSDGSANISYLMQEILSEPAYQTLDLAKIGLDFNRSLETLEYACNAVKEAFLR